MDFWIGPNQVRRYMKKEINYYDNDMTASISRVAAVWIVFVVISFVLLIVYLSCCICDK